MKQRLPPIIEYYHREQQYLLEAGAQFAKDHPKLAKRLDWNGGSTADPHVERLLESFAFLTARLQRTIDDKFPEISSALLHLLYPQLVRPIPSMAIAHFEIDARAGKFPQGFLIPRTSPLFAQSLENTTCQFHTCYDVKLWPITIEEYTYLPRESYSDLPPIFQTEHLLRLRLKSLGQPLNTLQLSTLRFHLSGSEKEAQLLYSLLFGQEARVALYAEGKYLYTHPLLTLKSVGFSPQEACLPYPSQSHAGYRYLHEFFYFPEKFLFFDIQGLNLQECLTYVDILITVPNSYDIRQLPRGTEQVKLGCTPIINLFPKNTEPFRLTHQQDEYRLTSDQRREATTEIHSIIELFQLTGETGEPEALPPFYSLDHASYKKEQKVFWVGRHRPSKRFKGTDYALSFVDLALNPHLPAANIIYAKTWCTNRHLATQIPPGGKFQIEIPTPTKRIYCLNRPSSPGNPPLDGQTQWLLISHLAMNYLAHTNSEEAVEHLKHLLSLYGDITHGAHAHVIESLVSLTSRPLMRRIGKEAWRGFISGQRVELLVEETDKAPAVFLLASVLNHFFRSQNAVNSFHELVLKSSKRNGVWFHWPMILGDQCLL